MIALNGILSGFLQGITLVILILAWYSYRRRDVAGAKGLFYLCVVSSFYVFGYSMELVALHLSQINFWSKVQYIGLPFIPTLWVLLAISFARKGHTPRPLFYTVIYAFPFLTLFFRWTSDWNQMHYGKMLLVNNGFFDVLQFDKGPWYYLHFVFFLFCAFYAARLYFAVVKAGAGDRKKQAVLMLTASLMPVFSIVTNLLSIFPLSLDSGPFFIALNYGIFAVGIFRYSFLRIIPLSKEKVFEWISDGVVILDLQLNILDYNPAAKRIFQGLSPDIIGEPLDLITSPVPAFTKAVERWFGKQEASSRASEQISQPEPDFHFSLITDKGHVAYYQGRLSGLFNGDKLLGIIVLLTEITKQQEMLLELEHSARTDALTGLMNRGYFIELFQHSFDLKDEDGINCTLMMIDIDFFKVINDRYGHLAGDYVLKRFASCLEKGLRQDEIVCRYGGEEFLVLLPTSDPHIAAKVAERLRAAIESMVIDWESGGIAITASFGVALSHCGVKDVDSGGLRTFDDLVNRADQALYQAKAQGRNCVVFSTI